MESLWQKYLPDSLLLEIFTYLDVPALGCVSRVCRSWHRVAADELLWQAVAKSLWNIKGSLASGMTSWKAEVKRLRYHVPSVCTETIQQHTDEVLDVHISHNGQYFSTCSKDAQVILWRLEVPAQKVTSFDTNNFLRWQLTQYSVFSPDDALLLVCGVKSYALLPDDYEGYRAGAGAVFTVPDLNLVCLVEMHPPTIFGSWLSDRTFISAWPGTRPDSVEIRAFQVTEERISHPVLLNSTEPQLLSFNFEHISYERLGTKLFCLSGNRYHLMNLLVARVIAQTETIDLRPMNIEGSWSVETDRLGRKRTPEECSEEQGAPKLSQVKDKTESCLADDGKSQLSSEGCLCGDTRHVHKSSHNVRKNNEIFSEVRPSEELSRPSYVTHTVSRPNFCVAFVTGNHDKIAVMVLKDTHNEILEGRQPGNSPSSSDSLDTVDHMFTLKDCYITGVCTSHDQRKLYFNFRELDRKASGYGSEEVGNLEHNDIDSVFVSERVYSGDLKIGCIDLVTMERVKDTQYEGHVGYSEFPAWYICLDASQDYIGSGSEDMRGYIWDRHYMVNVCNLSHSPLSSKEIMTHAMANNDNFVVNGIAFSPVDQETCITVCDDKLIKVWRSKNRENCLNSLKEANSAVFHNIEAVPMTKML